MTLIVAGHSLEKITFSGISSTHVRGLFAASDSSITSGGTTLVSGFKKVVEVPIRVKGLNFCGEWFDGYHDYRYEDGCFVAFAGSTLVAQHIMNSIKNHLGEIYPTYEDEEYKLVMSCEPHRHLRQIDYDDSMFLDKHLNGLLSAKLVSNIVRHSIQAVLDSAQKHDGMRNNFRAFQAEFILGFRCPLDYKYYLYQYEIHPDNEKSAIVNMTQIQEGDVAVIGLKEQYSEEAKDHFQKALDNGDNTAIKMHEFIVNAIEDQNSLGVFSIGKPCGLYMYEGRYVTLKKYIR